jgi:UDP:flavonoid glycosyltransferase YjiC (YdhE family)
MGAECPIAEHCSRAAERAGALRPAQRVADEPSSRFLKEAELSQMRQLRRKRVLFVGEAATLSHVARPAVLAQALEPEQYEVVMACDPRYNALFAGLPFPLIPIQSLPSETILARAYRGQPLFGVKTLARYVQEDLRILRELSPDLVVGDLRQSLAVSSRLVGIPFVNIINAHWSPYAHLEFELAEHPLIGILGESLTQKGFKRMFPLSSTFFTLPLNIIRMRYGLPWLGFNIKQVYTYGDYTVYSDVPELVPTYNLPSNHLYLGPILWSPHVELPAWWNRMPSDKPIVYISLGTSGQHMLLNVILRALADLPIYVMVATAAWSKLDAVPSNVYLADYLPGLEAAQRSSLVICNGGTMSGQQGLAAGAPILGVVSNIDQLVFMKAVSQVGAGEMLREGKVTGASVKSIVSKMLSQSSYRESAQKIAKVFQNYDAAENFKRLIDTIFVASSQGGFEGL